MSEKEAESWIEITSKETKSKNAQRLITLNGWRIRVTVGLFERNPDGSLKGERDPQTKEFIPSIKKIVSGEDGVSMAYLRIEEIG